MFDKDIFELKTLIEGGASEEDLSDSAAEKARKFLHIRHVKRQILLTHWRHEELTHLKGLTVML